MEINKVYSNQDIMAFFKVANSGGIRISTKKNCILLFMNQFKKSNIPYEDNWGSDNIIHYSGQGKEGDQLLTRNNKALANVNDSNKKIYVFESYKPREHTFLGEANLVSQPYQVELDDGKGNMRKVYKFPIRLLDESLQTKVLKLSDFEKKDPKKNAERISDLNKKRKINKSSIQETVITYDRNPTIANYVKEIAEGRCQLCEKEAPFNDNDGRPFLHAHHIEYLSNGGLDTIDNCIAVCPNCHARIHVLERKKDKEKLLDKVKSRKGQ